MSVEIPLFITQRLCETIIFTVFIMSEGKGSEEEKYGIYTSYYSKVADPTIPLLLPPSVQLSP